MDVVLLVAGELISCVFMLIHFHDILKFAKRKEVKIVLSFDTSLIFLSLLDISAEMRI